MTESELWTAVYLEHVRRGSWQMDCQREADQALEAYRKAFDSAPPKPYDPESPEAIAARVLAGVDGAPAEWFKPGEP